MGLVVNTNISALIAQRNVNKANNKLSMSVERLSSGLRINRAMDDAAGLAISEKLKAHTRSIYAAIRNGNEGINMLQVADGSLKEIGDILQRMRELAEQAANSTLGTSERNSLDAEYQQLKNEIDRISDATEYNGQKLIDGSISASANALSFQIGFQNVAANDRVSLSIADAASSTLTINTGNVAAISTAALAQSSLTQVDSAISLIATRRGDIGAVQSRMSSAISNLSATAVNYESAISSITDVDFAFETAQFTKNQILSQAAVSVLAQANIFPQQALALLS